MKVEIKGGIGPYEAAAIVAAITRITEEQAAAAAEPSQKPQQSAWVAALSAEHEAFEEDPLRPSLFLEN